MATATPPASARRTRRAVAAQELERAFRGLTVALRRLRGRDTRLPGGSVSHAQLVLLVELEDRGELPVGELAAAAQLTPATVTQMLDHLEAAGHVERARSTADRRVVVARLTAQGRRGLREKREAWAEQWERALAGLDAQELDAAAKVLGRLRAMMEGLAAE